MKSASGPMIAALQHAYPASPDDAAGLEPHPIAHDRQGLQRIPLPASLGCAPPTLCTSLIALLDSAKSLGLCYRRKEVRCPQQNGPRVISRLVHRVLSRVVASAKVYSE